LRPDVIPINAGMVAIIGARGSGKTALADLIATGGFGVSKQLNGSSFLRRAADYLTDSRVKLTWENGSETENDVASQRWKICWMLPTFNICRSNLSKSSVLPKD
jgi:ABC-type phosphate/phosphonate transport system ATPase subunit